MFALAQGQQRTLMLKNKVNNKHGPFRFTLALSLAQSVNQVIVYAVQQNALRSLVQGSRLYSSIYVDRWPLDHEMPENM